MDHRTRNRVTRCVTLSDRADDNITAIMHATGLDRSSVVSMLFSASDPAAIVARLATITATPVETAA